VPRQQFRTVAKPSANPRRVRGGVKIPGDEGAIERAWASARFWRLVEQAAGGDALRGGLEYARLGQTKRLDIGGVLDSGGVGSAPGTPGPGALPHGVIVAYVQGRMPRAYRTELRLTPLSAAQRDQLTAALLEQPRVAAKLLAGELPQNIDDATAPAGVHLFPAGVSDVSVSCTCADPTPATGWCKHAVCAAALAAMRLAAQPLEIVDLRGLPRGELIERLRDQRAITSGAAVGPAPVYAAAVPGASDVRGEALDAVSAADFWRAGPELDRLDTPIERPGAGHVLLRRLGPSPFPEGRFPLVGLLATCYELISEHAVRTDDDGTPPAR
jgi:uncharacterized Zn finger protein